MIDLYPTRDHGFTKHNRKYTDKRSSWLVQGISIRRNSYSNANTRDGVEESKGLYYGDKPIKTHRHPNHHKGSQLCTIKDEKNIYCFRTCSIGFLS